MSVDEELVFLSARELIARYCDGSLSPVEATRATLERIATLDGTINAYCLVDGDAAMAAARTSEARWRRGAPAGPLDGVPTSIKDIVLTRGWPKFQRMFRRPLSGTGSGRTTRSRWRVCASCVAVILGKTTTSEFAMKGDARQPP